MQHAPSPALSWSEAFELDLDAMDQTHREFVDLLAAAGSADDTGLPGAWQALVDHTADHFGREDDWMRSTRFAASNCHTVQHKVVLQVMRDGLAQLLRGELAPVRQMIGELAIWFPQHAQLMDAALAQHLKRVGYDTRTGTLSEPGALPEREISGCGGACSAP